MPTTCYSGVTRAQWDRAALTIARYGNGMFDFSLSVECASLRTRDTDVQGRVFFDRKKGFTWKCWHEAQPQRTKTSDTHTQAIELAVIDLMSTMFHLHAHAKLQRDLKREEAMA